MSDEAPRRLRSVHVVGTGLIGTSIGLVLSAAGIPVTLADSDEQRVARAAAMGAGRPGSETEPADLVVVAVPPASVAEVAARQISADVARTVTHVASVQARPLLEIEALTGRSERFVGGHPIAGREQSGPDAAIAGLFRDRAWVLCPAPYTSDEAIADVEELVALCKARAVRMAPSDHDELLARLSHVPQLVASSLAASVADLPTELVALAGSGLRDTTRLADSDIQLWTEIISANPAAVGRALRDVAGAIGAVTTALDSGDRDGIDRAVAGLLARGQAGRAKLPGKHGQRAMTWATVSVVVPDRPGALAELLADVARHDVNLEDLRVEHAPGHPEGAAELAVAGEEQGRLVAALRADGWSVSIGADAAH
ncbi:MAG TPA: prephenate dehydrogenase [Amnibacterium sp.]|nr:prephenate dehydrogenase [Amnibacterium sp.]